MGAIQKDHLLLVYSVWVQVCSGMRSSATNKSLLAAGGGPIMIIGVVRDNHGSFHTCVDLPLPMTLPICGLIRSLPMQIPHHPCDAEEGVEHSRNEVDTQYFPSRTRARRHAGFVKILQLTFARRASLNFFKSRKPKPPYFFICASFSQETQHIFFFSIFASPESCQS